MRPIVGWQPALGAAGSDRQEATGSYCQIQRRPISALMGMHAAWRHKSRSLQLAPFRRFRPGV